MTLPVYKEGMTEAELRDHTREVKRLRLYEIIDVMDLAAIQTQLAMGRPLAGILDLPEDTECMGILLRSNMGSVVYGFRNLDAVAVMKIHSAEFDSVPEGGAIPLYTLRFRETIG